PGVAVVYATAHGELEWVEQPLASFRMASRGYRLRYEVDVADHVSVVTESMSSQTEPYEFVVTARVDWAVTDPVEVVRRRSRDGVAVVRARVGTGLRSLFATYAIERFPKGASLQAQLDSPDLPEGIRVHRIHIEAVPDLAARVYLRDLERWRQDQQRQ